MASSPITSWQLDGKTMVTVTDFLFLDSKITADGGCSYENKEHDLRLSFPKIELTPIRALPFCLDMAQIIRNVFYYYFTKVTPASIISTHGSM